jgi:heptosyltransferase-2
MKTLVIKLNATGDVVRTTAILNKLPGEVTWITAKGNVPLVAGIRGDLVCVDWDNRSQALKQDYDLLINLEDEVETAAFAKTVKHRRTFGAWLDADGKVQYTDDARDWFDMSLISRFGRQRADELKLLNRRTYQDMIFTGLGMRFEEDPYLLPEPAFTDLAGDVAISPVAGPVWPMKNWAYYDMLKLRLEAAGLRVNMLPKRSTLLEHLGDIRNHRCLVGGDSLPMHLALGVGTACVTIFNCTSPWEIHDYGLQTKIVSPLLAEFFYKRGMDSRATTAISVDDVFEAVMLSLAQTAAPIGCAG